MNETSAYLNSKEHIIASNAIKRFIIITKEIIFIIDNDFILATYLATKVIVEEGKLSIDCIVNAPQSKVFRMNHFLFANINFYCKFSNFHGYYFKIFNMLNGQILKISLI